MAGKVAGFTLIEILVAISILAVLLAIAIPSYTHWQNERQLTSEARKVNAFVQQERTRAFSTSQQIDLSVDGNSRICSEEMATGQERCLQTEYALASSHNSITINSNGIFEPDPSWIGFEDQELVEQYSPRFSCINLTTTKARLGQYENGECTPE